MEYDFAIIYFGLTRSVKKTHETHKKHVFDVLQKENLSYKTFLHTWKTKDDIQNVGEYILEEKIDYSEYKLLSPDFYKLDDEDEFLESINMDDYFYKHVWETIGHSPEGEWLPKMLSNHLCMLESQKRAFNMVKTSVLNGDKFKYIMFIRPDITIHNDLPVVEITDNKLIYVPNHSHHGGLNDQFAIMSYEYAHLYGNRIDEAADYRKKYGRIAGETYCIFIIRKYNMEINQIDFRYSITRP